MTRLRYRETILAGQKLTRDAYDPWGTVMEHLFLIAATQLSENEQLLPGYRPGLGVVNRDHIETEYSDGANLVDLIDAGEITADDLAEAFRVLSRYDDLLRYQGLGY